jgi:DNA-binding GntR family transcriptional regulator
MKEFIYLHEALVDAIEQRDAEKIKRRLLEHFQEAIAWSKEELKSTDRINAFGSDIYSREAKK